MAESLPVIRKAIWSQLHYMARKGRLEPWVPNWDAEAPSMRFTYDNGDVVYIGFSVNAIDGIISFHVGPSPRIADNPVLGWWQA